MRIRLLRQKDIDEVISVIILSYKNEDKNRRWDENVAREYIRRIYKLNKDFCFVATEGEKIVGVALSRVSPEFNKYILISDMLLVHPEYRRKRIASKLLRKMCIKAKNKYGIEDIQTSVYTLLDFPIMWYESIGFRNIANTEVIQNTVNEILKNI